MLKILYLAHDPTRTGDLVITSDTHYLCATWAVESFVVGPVAYLVICTPRLLYLHKSSTFS